MNVYYNGGKIRDYERVEKWTDDWSLEDAPQIKKIGAYKFKLHPIMSIDGGFIYTCINETIEPCEECEGHGSQRCEFCDGTGFTDCQFCDGNGSLSPTETDREKLNREEKDRKQQEFMKNQINLF